MRHLLVRLTCLAIWLSSPAGALAGAFNQERGQAQAIYTTTFTTATDYLSLDRRLLSGIQFSKVEKSLLVEYGVSDSVTAIIKPTFLSASFGGSLGDRAFDNFGPTDVGAQVRLWGQANATVAVQGLIHLPSKALQINKWLVGQTRPEPEIRTMFGYATQLSGMNVFTDLQAGFRLRAGGPPNEWHADLTHGLTISSGRMLMIQTFYTRSGGSQTPELPSFSQRKLQLSLVQQFGGLSIQAGLFRTLSGQNAYVEHGTMMSVWARF